MAFKLGELRAGLVNAAVGVDIEVVVVIDLPVAACRPVQVELRDMIAAAACHNGKLRK